MRPPRQDVSFLDALGEEGVWKLIGEELRGLPVCPPGASRQDIEDWVEELGQLAWRLRKDRGGPA